MAKPRHYTIRLLPEPEGGYTVRVPALPPVVTYGETYEQAMAMAREAIELVLEVYRERRDATLTALEQYLPDGCRWTRPDGGFYVWLTVPEGVDTKAMLPRAVTARVAYASGTGFYADGFGSRQLRLSFCYPTPERITEGVRRLAGVLEAELDVVRTFGSAARPRPSIQGPQAPSPDTT